MVACYDVWLHHATNIYYAVTIPHLVSPLVVRQRVIPSAPLKKKVRWRRKRVLETLENLWYNYLLHSFNSTMYIEHDSLQIS